MLPLLLKRTNLHVVIVFVKSVLWFGHALGSVLNTVTSVSSLIVEKRVDMNDNTYTEVIWGAMYNAVIYCPSFTLLLWSLDMVFCFLLEVL